MKRKIFAMIFILAFFVFGYGLAYYQGKRMEIGSKIWNFQSDLLIVNKLLQEYSKSCNEEGFNNFSIFQDHAISRFVAIIKNAENFPYFYSERYTEDFMELADSYKKDLLELRENFYVKCE